MTMPKPPFAPLVTALVCLTALCGCSAYQLRGVVLEGSQPGIEIVSKDDPRLEHFGISGASLSVNLNPDRLSSKQIGYGNTDSQGRFSLPISETGAGFLLLDVEVLVQRETFGPVLEQLVLPGGDKRLIVTLKPGKGASNPDFLRDTLRDAEVYR